MGEGQGRDCKWLNGAGTLQAGSPGTAQGEVPQQGWRNPLLPTAAAIWWAAAGRQHPVRVMMALNFFYCNDSNSLKLWKNILNQKFHTAKLPSWANVSKMSLEFNTFIGHAENNLITFNNPSQIPRHKAVTGPKLTCSDSSESRILCKALDGYRRELMPPQRYIASRDTCNAST